MSIGEGSSQGQDSSLNTSLTSIQWLQELEPSNLVSSSQNAAKSAPKRQLNMEEDEDARKRRKVSREEKHTGETPPQCRKPPFSYATLIAFAINSDPDKRMTLSQIYCWIEDNFPYFKTARSAWKNSIRHNLSLRDTFIKEKRSSFDQGKGSYWKIAPGEEDKLLRTTFRQLRQQQYAAGPVYLNPQLLSNGMAKITPLLPRTPNVHPLSSLCHPTYLTFPVSIDPETGRPKQRVILPKGPIVSFLSPPAEPFDSETPPWNCIVAPHAFINDHGYSSSSLRSFDDEDSLSSDFNDPVQIDSPGVSPPNRADPSFTDLLAEFNASPSPLSFHVTSTDDTSPSFISSSISPDGRFDPDMALNALFATPWKNASYDVFMTSLPGTPIRSGLTPSKGSPPPDGLGSLKGLGLPGLTPIKDVNLDMSGIDGFLEV
eukprot:m.311038 g.311038  ORF g.311038 m.311038 type:complete len:430 (+) comp58491_c0_seq1:141-1430(+)